MSVPMLGEQTVGKFIYNATLVLSGAALVFLAVYGWALKGWTRDWPAVFISGSLICAASVGIGILLGFIFGLPRSRAVEDVSDALKGRGDRSVTSFFLGNSNLIKVSDWLTTIILGLGLVNLGQVEPKLSSLAGNLAGPFGGDPQLSAAAGLATTIAGSVLGFVLMYLWTSIRVRLLLEAAERAAKGEKVVPDVVGKTVAQAKSCLTAAGFDVDDMGADAVVKVKEQDPPANAWAVAGVTVTLTSKTPIAGRGGRARSGQSPPKAAQTAEDDGRDDAEERGEG